MTGHGGTGLLLPAEPYCPFEAGWWSEGGNKHRPEDTFYLISFNFDKIAPTGPQDVDIFKNSVAFGFTIKS